MSTKELNFPKTLKEAKSRIAPNNAPPGSDDGGYIYACAANEDGTPDYVVLNSSYYGAEQRYNINPSCANGFQTLLAASTNNAFVWLIIDSDSTVINVAVYNPQQG
ncbi:MAG: hypothetical protein IT222_10055 [Crocinitomix sp.]|nr:hypothetical protein [Crocinitomix sp.]